MNELTVVQNLIPETIFTQGGADPLIDKIRDEVKKFVPDMTSKKGRDECRSFARKISSSKTLLERMRKDLTLADDIRRKKIVNAGKSISNALDELRDLARKPLTEYETKEKLRIEKHETLLRRLVDIKNGNFSDKPSSEIQCMINDLASMAVNESLEEFRDRAQMYKDGALNTLNIQFETKVKYENDQLELEQLRKQQSEQQEKERLQKLKDDQARKDAEENTRREIQQKQIEEKAKRDAEERVRADKEKIEQEKRDAEQRELQAKRDKEAAEKRATESEERAKRERIESKKREEEAIKKAQDWEREKIRIESQRKKAEEIERQKDVEHKATIHNYIANTIHDIVGVDVEASHKILDAISDNLIDKITIEY